MRQQGVCVEETSVPRGERQVDCGDKVVAGDRWNVEMIFKYRWGVSYFQSVKAEWGKRGEPACRLLITSRKGVGRR